MPDKTTAVAAMQEQVREAILDWWNDEARKEPLVKDIPAELRPRIRSNCPTTQSVPSKAQSRINTLFDQIQAVMMGEVNRMAADIKKLLVKDPDASAGGLSMRISTEGLELCELWRLTPYYDRDTLHHDFQDTDTLAWVHHLLIEHRSEIAHLLLLCAASPSGDGLKLRDSGLGRLLDEPPVRICLPEHCDGSFDTPYLLAHRRRRHIMLRSFRTLTEHCSVRPDEGVGKDYLHITGDGLALSDLNVTTTAGISIRIRSWMNCGVFNTVVLSQAAESLEKVMEWACFADPKKIPQLEAYQLASAFENPDAELPF